MKRYTVSKEYSYVDGRGQVQESGKVLTLDENSEHVKGQLYKLVELDPKPEEPKKEDPKPEVVAPEEMKKESIVEKMVTKMVEDDTKKSEAKPAQPQGTIKSRMEEMIKKQHDEKKAEKDK